MLHHDYERMFNTVRDCLLNESTSDLQVLPLDVMQCIAITKFVCGWADIQTGELQTFIPNMICVAFLLSFLSYASEPVYYWSHDDDETPIKVLSLVEACRCSTIRKEYLAKPP